MTEYHYVLTAQFPAPNGFQVFTSRGVLNLTPQATRAEAFEFIRNDLRDRAGLADEPSILFFCLEPNRIDAAPVRGEAA